MSFLPSSAGVDFNSSVLVFTVPSGSDDYIVQVEVFDDGICENSREVFALLLSLSDTSSAGAEVNPQMNATLLIIQDNEGRSLPFRSNTVNSAQ